MNLFEEIINSGKGPDEIKSILCEAMGVESLRLSDVLIYLDKNGLSLRDALDVRLYLTLQNLLEK